MAHAGAASGSGFHIRISFGVHFRATAAFQSCSAFGKESPRSHDPTVRIETPTASANSACDM
nr:MAG TPA: hypothetical protein [Caudoviricetes sp.]